MFSSLTIYYNQEFFNTIKKVRETTSLNIATMSTIQWYDAILSEEFLMEHSPEENQLDLRKSKIEGSLPNVDWKLVCARCTMKCLSPEGSSFVWIMLQRILPTHGRKSS